MAKQYKGKFTTWHSNGQILSEGSYINGKLEGKATKWYEDGEIALMRYYKNGVRVK